MAKESVRIAGGQGFYGDSPMAAIAIANFQAADYIVHDALAELTLSILQKDKMRDPNLGYARDIEFMAKTLYPLAIKNGIKIVTNSGGLNPENAARKVSEILTAQGLTGVKIASISGDNFITRLEEVQAQGNDLAHLDNGEPFSSVDYLPTHANVYIGAKSIVEALSEGADIILAGRVADPCLTLGVLAHHFGWDLEGEDLDKLAAGIAIGHLLECGGQASGGNAYSEWPMDYKLSNLGYPIAEVSEDGSAIFTKLENQGGKMSRNTLREQLVYEIHDPANYLTPDVTVDFTGVKIEEIAKNKVSFSGVKGKPRPEQLKLTIGLMEGFLSEQFFFMSWPYAYKKAVKMVEAVQEIWIGLGIPLERVEHSFIGLNGIHGEAIDIDERQVEDINEVGVRLCIKHQDAKTGKLAMQAIVCLGLNGPPGIISKPAWGKPSMAMLSLWPTLVDRDLIKEKVDIITT